MQNVVGKHKMTHQQFQETVKKKNLFDRYWYLGLSILTILLGLILLFLIATHPDKFKGNHIFHYSCFSFLLFLGTYGLYKLSNRYKIISIYSTKPLNDKKTALSAVVELFGSTPRLFSDNYISFRYQKNFWSSSFHIHLFFDDHQVCFSVQGKDSSDGGFIDLGGTEKLRRKLRGEIEMHLE